LLLPPGLELEALGVVRLRLGQALDAFRGIASTPLSFRLPLSAFGRSF
jgi:hypothetical protein